MAHALTYVNFSVKGIDEDTAFKQRFTAFSAVARPIYDRMKHGEPTFLDSYAGTNFQEFWAVSVETFFERSEDFKVQMPRLYEAMCILLKQDPIYLSTNLS